MLRIYLVDIFCDRFNQFFILGEVEGVTYPQEGTSSDDSSSQLFCEGLNPDTESISLTDDVSCSLQLASNIYCDNQVSTY